METWLSENWSNINFALKVLLLDTFVIMCMYQRPKKMVNKDGGCLVVLIGELALELGYKTWLSWVHLFDRYNMPYLGHLEHLFACVAASCLPWHLGHGTKEATSTSQPCHCFQLLWYLAIFANSFNWLNGRWPQQKCHSINSAWSLSAEALISWRSLSSSNRNGEKVSWTVDFPAVWCLTDCWSWLFCHHSSLPHLPCFHQQVSWCLPWPWIQVHIVVYSRSV